METKETHLSKEDYVKSYEKACKILPCKNITNASKCTHQKMRKPSFEGRMCCLCNRKPNYSIKFDKRIECFNGFSKWRDDTENNKKCLKTWRRIWKHLLSGVYPYVSPYNTYSNFIRNKVAENPKLSEKTKCRKCNNILYSHENGNELKRNILLCQCVNFSIFIPIAIRNFVRCLVCELFCQNSIFMSIEETTVHEKHIFHKMCLSILIDYPFLRHNLTHTSNNYCKICDVKYAKSDSVEHDNSKLSVTHMKGIRHEINQLRFQNYLTSKVIGIDCRYVTKINLMFEVRPYNRTFFERLKPDIIYHGNERKDTC